MEQALKQQCKLKDFLLFINSRVFAQAAFGILKGARALVALRELRSVLAAARRGNSSGELSQSALIVILHGLTLLGFVCEAQVQATLQVRSCLGLGCDVGQLNDFLRDLHGEGARPCDLISLLQRGLEVRTLVVFILIGLIPVIFGVIWVRVRFGDVHGGVLRVVGNIATHVSFACASPAVRLVDWAAVPLLLLLDIF